MIKKLNEIYDEAQQAYFVLYEAQGIGGLPVQATIPREERRVTNIIAALLRVGAEITDDEATKAAVAEARDAEAPIISCLLTVGWQTDGTFCTAFKAHGLTSQDAKKPPVGATHAYGSTLQLQGSIEGWLGLASIAYYSTAMIICLAALFAAPLLELLDLPSFAVMLFGKSRSGKSTAQWLAAAACGFRHEEDMPNLNATSAGLLAMAKASKDHAIFLNEAGTAAGRKKDVHDAIFKNCYAILGGRDVLRHNSWSGAKGANSTFKNIVVLSSEVHPDEWAQRAGTHRDAGEMARLIGVPVVLEENATIFDNANGVTNFDKQADQWFTNLRNEVPKHTGHVFDAYINDLVQQKAAIDHMGRWYVRDFQRELQLYGTNALRRDIIMKFGCLHAGAMTAIDMNRLPLTKCVVAKSLKNACISAMSALPDPRNDLKEDLSILARILSSEGVVDLDLPRNKDVSRLIHADGIRQRHGGGYVYTIRLDSLKKWFRNKARLQNLLEWLDTEGLLQGSKGQTGGFLLGWAVTQDCWIDRLRPRSVKLFLPRGMDNLKLLQ